MYRARDYLQEKAKLEAQMEFEIIKEASPVQKMKGDDVQVFDESDEESTGDQLGSQNS